NLYFNKIGEKEDRIIIPRKKVNLTYSLPEAWLAGLLGVIEVKIKHSNVIVVLRSDDIFSFTVARAPSRDENKEDLSEKEKERAREKAIDILEDGITIKHAPGALSSLNGVQVRLEDRERYILTLKGEDIDWLDFTRMQFSFPVNGIEPSSVEGAISSTGEGIQENADTLLEEIIANLSGKVLLRLMSYLENNRSSIELHKIARKGDGQDLAVTIEDTAVFEFLCQVCCLYPACLFLKGSIFIVKNGPLLWSIRDRIKRLKKNSPAKWETKTKEERELREYQKDIVDKLKERHRNKEHGSLVLAPTGSGKSLCVTTYIHWLIKKGFMYKYCVWILPSSATKAIKRQVKLAGLPVNIVDMRKESRNNKLIKNSINIIWHDHMRLNGMDEQLKKHAANMLFIVDEFHKTINKTIRTSITLEMIKLSAEFIGISGTIIINEDYKGIIPWLESIVPYEVNEHNYLVAAASLISKKVVLPIYVSRLEIEAKMINSEEYYQVVPESLGGTAKMLNLKRALEYCYESCLIEIVSLVKKYKKCLILTKDTKQQNLLFDILKQAGVKRIILIGKDNIVNLTEENKDVDVAITTKNYVE
ncbi:MAG TPA: DEAD/DEAH box helicase family protein, partial [Bacteroidales bacterium]|nr:DEAD/DEAH box helicase family protein [Bacteroidales bacterium]